MAFELGVVPLLLFLVYGRTLPGPFLFDDPALPGRGWKFARGYPLTPGRGLVAHLGQLHQYERSLYHLICRWLYVASVEKPGTIGTNAVLKSWPWHAANLAVHWLATIVVYWIFATWLPFHKAVFVAAVFAVHPIQTTSVGYISGLQGMLALLFTLAGIRHIQLGGWEHWALAALSQYFACKSKQEGFLYLALYPIFFFWFG